MELKIEKLKIEEGDIIQGINIPPVKDTLEVKVVKIIESEHHNSVTLICSAEKRFFKVSCKCCNSYYKNSKEYYNFKYEGIITNIPII